MEATSRENRRMAISAGAVILAWTLVRAIIAARVPLAPDESNYWQWGRYLDWGYHDQAPLIGWAIGLFTRIFGDNELAVRLPSIISVSVASAYVSALAWRWFSPRAALSAAILTQAILEYQAGGLLATPDGLQAMAWAACAYHGARAYEDHTWPQWIATGAWFGVGMLAKFTMVVIAPGILFFGLFSPAFRSRLQSVKPWLSFLMGCLFFSPVLVWNHWHGWNSARHVAHIGGADEGFGLHLKYFGDFLGSQAALLTPLVFILVIWALLKAFRGLRDEKRWIESYCFFTSAPLFGLFLILSFKSRIYGNWPGAAYLTACALTAGYFGTGSHPRLWKATITMAYGLTCLALLQTAWPVLPIPAKMDRAATELSGWKELGEAAGGMAANMPRPGRTFIFGLRYQEASQLAFYAPGKPRTVSINRWTRPNVYDYWWKDSDLMGFDAVGVTRFPEDAGALRQVFERVDRPVQFPVFRKLAGRNPEQIRTLYIYRCYGFLGGLEWIPKDARDIRAGSTP